MLSPVFAVPTPIICPTPVVESELVELELLVDPPDVDPPIVAPVNPADSAEPPLTVEAGVLEFVLGEAAPPNPVPSVDAEPRPPPAPVVFSPPSGWPKKPFTVVLFSPTWMMRQSSLPVSGSTYRLRKKRILFVPSSASMEGG